MAYLQHKGVLDPNNATVTPLLNTQSFTGTGTLCFNFAQVSVWLKSDQPCTISIEFSDDDVAYSVSFEATIADFTTPFTYSLPIRSKYYRVVLTNNSGSNQTALSLQSILSIAQDTIQGDHEDSWAPAPASVTGQKGLAFDASGNLKARSTSLTDEFSFRDDFKGSALSSDWVVDITGGASQSVSNSLLRLSSSTADANVIRVAYPADYCPITLRFNGTISQRITSQLIQIGLVRREAGVIKAGVFFQFVGTDNTAFQVVSCSDDIYSSSIETTEVKLLGGSRTSDKLYYKIDLSNNTVSFSVSTLGTNYYLLAQHSLHLPGPYESLDVEFYIENFDVVTNTNLDVDMMFFNNMNRLQTDDDFTYERESVRIAGRTDLGDDKDINATTEGHLEVAIHSPRLPFGSIHVENLTPVFQMDAVYGINLGLVKTRSNGSGATSASDSNFIASSGAVSGSRAVVASRKTLRYRPGQGVVVRWAGGYSTPVLSTRQFMGVSNEEDYLLFGYNGGDFGILYGNRGVREVQTLTVSAGASTAGNVTITLAGVATVVALTSPTSATKVAYDISLATYSAWSAQQIGNTVVFISDTAGNKTGAFTYAAGATGSAATFAETRAGVAVTEVFYPQTEWLVDKMDGFGSSGVILDPLKGNVYQIGLQYLGVGCITFEIETNPVDGNNATFTVVHALRLPNTLNSTSLRNPSFPFVLTSTTAGGANVSPRCSSLAGFIEGRKVLHGNRFTYSRELASVSTTTTALFTIMNALVYGGISNQSVINILNINVAVEHNNPVTFLLIKNGVLGGVPNFAQYDTSSCSLFDNAGTTVTTSSNAQIVWSGSVGSTGSIDHNIVEGSEINIQEVTLQPGEWITLAARSTGGPSQVVVGHINTREDQ